MVTSLTRALLIFLRAIPEYVWAFLFLAMLGASAWPAILALGLHNSGILGKLGAETVENLDPRPLRALRGIGATRAQIALSAIFPLSLSRYLLYVFYRFETCVREATVLGMLGVVSLGYWIQDARSRQFYDQMVLFVALGALIVLAADLFSALVRSRLRKAG
jgi:phosphonate transport system permease protein